MAKPNWRNQLILAASLFVLGTGAYWLEFSHKPKVEDQEERSKKVFDLKDLQITSLTIAGGSKSGAKPFELKCTDIEKHQCKPGDNSRWELATPLKAGADDSNANALVSSLNNLAPSDTISLKEETPEKRAALLKEYGLDPASRMTARRITIGLAGSSQSLVLGAAHPIGEGIFALKELKGQPDESQVYVVPSYLAANFDRDLTFWRNKKLFDFAAVDVRAFALEGSKGKFEGIKKDADWTLSSGAEKYLAADSEAVETLLSAAAYLTAKDFVPETKIAGAQPALKLSITLAPADAKAADPKAGATAAAPRILTLEIREKSEGKAAPKKLLFAKASTVDGWVELEPGSKDRLDKGVKDLRRNKLLSSLERYSIKRVEVSGPGIGNPPVVVTTLKSKDGKWQYDPAGKEVDGDKVQAMLEKLSGNRIKDFGSQPIDETGAVHLTLGDEKTPQKRQFVFWKKKFELFARDLTSGRKETLRIDPMIVTDLPDRRDFFDKGAPKASPSGAPAPSAEIRDTRDTPATKGTH